MPHSELGIVEKLGNIVESCFHLAEFISRPTQEIETSARRNISFNMCRVWEAESKDRVEMEIHFHNVVLEDIPWRGMRAADCRPWHLLT